MNWFDNIRNRQELKAEFRRLARIHHPDHGGDAAIMGEIICQYETVAKKLPQVTEEARENVVEPGPRSFHCVYRPKRLAAKIRPHRAWPRPGTATGKSAQWQKRCTSILQGRLRHQDILLENLWVS